MKLVGCNSSKRIIRSGWSGIHILVFLLGALTAHAQTGLSGYWQLKVPNGDGTFRVTYFELKQDGETITGKLFGRGPNGTPVAGSFKGGTLHFATVVSAPVGGSTFTGRQSIYDGTFEKDKLLLQTTLRGTLVKGVAERTTYEATLPPARLTLPGLHDVPDNGLVRTPPMGWNSWNKFAGKVDDATIRKTADAIVASGMSKAGYVYINIDDTWQGGRDSNGNIITNTKFPDMKALADYVHSKGLKIRKLISGVSIGRIAKIRRWARRFNLWSESLKMVLASFTTRNYGKAGPSTFASFGQRSPQIRPILSSPSRMMEARPGRLIGSRIRPE